MISAARAPVLLAVEPVSDFGDWARRSGLEIVLLVVGALLLARAITFVGDRVTARIDREAREADALVRSEASKHRHAVAQVLTWATVVLVYTMTALLVLERLGVPIAGLVAPATVAGVALGFGAQRVVQDVLAGFFIITERQYGFGDVVRIAPGSGVAAVTGTVEDVTLRITRVRTVDGEVVTTPNGQIVQVTNLSRDWARAVVDVPVPASTDVAVVSDALRRVGEELYADPEFQPLLLDQPSVMGVESFSVDQFNVRVVARTLPGKQFDVGRALRARIAAELRNDGVLLPPVVVDGADPTGTA